MHVEDGPQAGSAGNLLLGIDVGGTFTDVVVHDEESGSILVDKVPSTPGDQSVGVISAIRRLRDVHGLGLERLRLFAHGSTVATNALLELKLPRTAMVVTEGFRDVLEIGDQKRGPMFDLAMQKPPPLVPRELVFEAAERIDRDGNVVRELSEDELDRLADAVAAADVEACAISLLFAFRNPEHEQRIQARLAERLPNVSLAISSAVAPEIKEYPRSSTTAICASVQPLVARYIAGVERGLDEEAVQAPLFIMQSSGGVMSAREASQHAHRMLLSGPAAGVLGATRLAEASGHRNQITFDMGGTSTDICLIHEGRPALEREPEFDGRPLRVPQLDIHTIGSGGGSIAWIDEAGLLHVGPASAGAVPGPACYMRGGTLPTVTDAHVALGRVDPEHFLAGEMQLDADAAREAVRIHVAEPLGMSVDDAALGILDIADAQMARGMRVVSVNRGFDPREFTMVAYGGAGPMHALSAARLVDVGAVLIPRHPGAFSARGLVSADVRYDLVQMVERPVESFAADTLEALYAPLLEQATERMAALGDDAPPPRMVRVARLRYAWQDNDVEVIVGEAPVTAAALEATVARFHELHDFEFGYSSPEDPVELIAVCLEAYGELPRTAAPAAGNGTMATAEPQRSRPVCFRSTGWVDTAVYDRHLLPSGARFPGPAIIEEREATTIIGPQASVEVDGLLNLVLRAEA